MSASDHGFDGIIERERGLRRSLSARQLSMIAIGGAIGTGLFLGSGFAISLAGPGVLVSYLIGAVIALLLMGASLACLCYEVWISGGALRILLNAVEERR